MTWVLIMAGFLAAFVVLQNLVEIYQEWPRERP
jgi:hypothetical protein